MSARTDMSRIAPLVTRPLADARAFIRNVMHDVEMDKLIADARNYITGARTRISQRLDTSAVTSLVTRGAARAKPASDAAATEGAQAAGTTTAGTAMPDIQR